MHNNTSSTEALRSVTPAPIITGAHGNETSSAQNIATALNSNPADDTKAESAQVQTEAEVFLEAATTIILDDDDEEVSSPGLTRATSWSELNGSLKKVTDDLITTALNRYQHAPEKISKRDKVIEDALQKTTKGLVPKRHHLFKNMSAAMTEKVDAAYKEFGDKIADLLVETNKEQNALTQAEIENPYKVTDEKFLTKVIKWCPERILQVHKDYYEAKKVSRKEDLDITNIRLTGRKKL
mmetsp:Transcript_24847/g.48883  ORF Transcript_24847/g.48883 Transcript_24847/m.48883 type:complete len:239 (+) Transcript_24847:427-1143(+)